MSRSSRQEPASASSGLPTIALDRVLFYAILAILATRPLLAEIFAPLELSIAEAMSPAGSGTTPAAMALLDAILLLISGIALARRAVRPRRALLVGIGMVLLVAAVLVSSSAAGNKHIALLAGMNVVAIVAAGVALVALSVRRWQILLVIAALAATGTSTALKCFQQEFYEFPDTIDYWNTVQKPALIERGVDPNDPLFVNYERRLMSREPYGYLTHPNVTASVLAMSGLALLGVALAAVARRKPDASGIVALLAAITAAVAIWLTGSLGAIVAGAGALIVLGILGVARGWIARHARAALAVFFGGYLALIAGGAAYGLAKGTLPHPSLAFRWYYWTAAGKAYLHDPLTGIGRENFLPAYLQYKPVQSTEDVRNPHNVWLSLLVEMGPLGLLAGGVLIFSVVRRSIRGLPPRDEEAPPAEEQRIDWRRAVPVALGVVILHAGLSGTPFGSPGVALLWAFDFAAKWVGAFAVFCWILGTIPLDGRARGWIGAGLIAAIAAMLVQSLLSFGLLTPGGLAFFTLIAVAAVGLATGGDTAPAVPRMTAGRWGGIAATCGVFGAYTWFVAIPTAAAVTAPDAIRAALYRWRPGTPPAPPAAVLDRVLATTDRDPAPARQAAREILGFSQLPQLTPADREPYLLLATRAAEAAQRRNPLNPNHFSLLGTVFRLRAEAAAALGDAKAAQQLRQEAAENWQRAVDGNPKDPRTRISAANAWFEIWQRTNEADAARHVRENLDQALWIDSQRPAEDAARLPPAEIARIKAMLKAVEAGHRGDRNVV